MEEPLLIQNIPISIPDQPSLGLISGYRYKQKDQYFRRTEIPSFMDDIQFDADGDPVYTKDQKEFAFKELERCRNGFWFMSDGVATYINGAYYYWLNYWILEDGNQPEYRECDRLFFIFFIACYRNPHIAAIIRGKARREGATSHGACIEMWIATNAAGFGGNKRCGNISKTGGDVDDLFESMIVRGFKGLPVYLRPRIDGPSDPKNEIKLRKPGKKKEEKGVDDISRQGLNSIITKRDTSLNAYDSGRWSFILIDESGKWKIVNILGYWRKVKDVLVQGAVRVGFAYLPTTVNPPNDGGNNFKKIWDQADQFKYELNRLPQQMVKYFKPAYDGLNGFIDRYGRSVIHAPNKETLDYLVKKNSQVQDEQERVPEEYLCMGAKAYLDLRLSLLQDEEDKSEERRKYPQCEEDMFDFGATESPFNTEKIMEQKKFLKDNPVPWLRGNLIPVRYKEDGKEKMHVEFWENKTGNWLIKDFPKIPNNFTIDDRGVVHPMSTHIYGGGADTFRFDSTVQLGSKGVIVIGTKMDGAGEGGEACAYYIGRPKLTELFWKEIMLGCLWYGCTITVEKDATQEYIKYFQNKIQNVLELNCLPMLGRKPDITVDPNRKVPSNQNISYGASSADPFTFSKEIELLQIYIEKHIEKVKLIEFLDAFYSFDVSNRTKSDTVIGFMMWLLNITGDFQQRKKDPPKWKLIQQFKINKGIPGFSHSV